MRSSCSPEFWKRFRRLPEAVRAATKEAYGRWRENPRHPGLRFKMVDAEERIYSARVTRSYRACCFEEDGEYTWFFVGTHEEYDRLLDA